MKKSVLIFCYWLLVSLTCVSSVRADLNPAALPSVGYAELRVLNPTLIELVRVTTKDPDPALPKEWNFVGENFALNLPAANNFQVLVNGQIIPVSGVGFKRRPLFAPLKKRDLRIENSLFLALSSPIPDGATVHVKDLSSALWTDSNSYSGAAKADRFNPAIHVNQTSYAPNATKKGMVGFYLGSMGEMPVTATTFSVVNRATGQAVFSGALKLRKDVGYSYSPLPYQQVYEADFSAVQTEGEYVVQVPGMGVSYPFLVTSGSAAAFARAYALGLYHQRCGMKNELPHTRFEHGVCHAAPAEVPNMTFEAVNRVLADVSSDYTSNPLHTAPQLKDVNSSLYPFINTQPIDVSGGHHDAGDYSKYTINSAGLIHHLVFAADNFGASRQLDNLGLPESHDGKSDLLQEAKWEADFLAKLQDADGGFYFLVYPRNRRYEDDVLPDHGDTQVVFPKTTASTAAAVAALAEIASSPTFKAQFPQEAAAYLAKARKGWDFLAAAIATYGKNGSYQKITHYGNEFMHDDELAWAAAALFAATGEAQFHTKLIEWYDPTSPDTKRWTWWRLFEGYGCAARTYAFAVKSGRLPAGSLDATYLSKCTAEILGAGDDIARFAEQTSYGTSFPDPNKRFRSAGWYFSMERAFELATAQQLNPQTRYMDAILSNLSYEAGANPVNMNYITGLGWKRWRDIVHQYAQNDHRILPPSGIPLGNIQGGFAYLENYKQELGRLAYPPDGATSAPYPYYDRFGDTFNTTTEFVVVDQARALATTAFLLAQTGDYVSPSKNMVGTITGLPGTSPAETVVTANLQIEGVDLSQARITWEALDQEPFVGHTFKFAPKNAGAQWVEAEAQLPDGRRVYGRTSFMATFSESVQANSYQSAPLTTESAMVAHYHLDGTLADATGKNAALVLAGNAAIDTMNLGWMTQRSGKALRVNDLGDTAKVTIPGNLLYSSGVTKEITIEAMVFVQSYKAYNRSTGRLFSLVKGWNASIEWIEDLYAGPRFRGGTQFDVGGSTFQSLPIQKWHHLSITIGATGYSVRVNGVQVVFVPSSELQGWNNGPAALEIGNFDGWIDEVVVRNAPLTPPAALNIAPTVTLTKPVQGTVCTLGTTIQLEATAADQDGTVQKVEFYADDIPLGADTSAPYTLSLVDVPLGTHAFRAVATDNIGAATTSSTIEATVEIPRAKATFLGLDAATQGNWKYHYASEGYQVSAESLKYPAYAVIKHGPNSTHTWTTTTTELRAMQRSLNGGRIASCWFGATEVTITNDFTDGLKHRYAAYFLDWDKAGRIQTIEIVDANSGQVIDTRTISNFSTGAYCVWEIEGKFIVRVKKQGKGNAVMSGFFMGEALNPAAQKVATPVITPNGGSFVSSALISISTATAGATIRYTTDGSVPTANSPIYSAPFSVTKSGSVQAAAFHPDMPESTVVNASFTVTSPNQATFVGIDNTTQGNWRGVYGSAGHVLTTEIAKAPAYATVSLSGKSDYTWSTTTTELRALQRPETTNRFAAAWYSASKFDVRVNIASGTTSKVSFYCMDWDKNRSQRVDVVDAATGQIIDTQNISNFIGGQYLTWNVSGNVIFRFTKITGYNAVVSGVFFNN